MSKAVIIGETGQIGLGTARQLVDEGWEVTVASRHAATRPEGCRHLTAGVRDAATLQAAVGSDTDLLMSCVAFDGTDAQCLVEAGRAAGRILAISSAGVYCDDKGHTLDQAAANGFPVFPVPLTETHATIAPGPGTYSSTRRWMGGLCRPPPMTWRERSLPRSDGPIAGWTTSCTVSS